jgi:dipeptidyl-peptidase-4
MNIKFYRSGLMCLVCLLLVFSLQAVKAQRGRTHWAADGYQYYRAQGNEIVELDTRDAAKKTVLVTKEMLTLPGQQPLSVSNFFLSDDGQRC